MAHKIAQGDVIKWTNSTGSDVASGQVVVVGDRVYIAATDIPDGETGALHARGVFAVPKAAEDQAQGRQLYWDSDGNPVNGVAGSGCVTTTAADVPMGYVYAAAAAVDETVEVALAD